jgi:hypothetical protein
MSLNLLLMNGTTVTGGPILSVDLGNSIVDRPAPLNGPQAIHYSQFNKVIDKIQDKTHVWYFTLAKGFSVESCTAKYWHDAMHRAVENLTLNLIYNLEYHSDAVTLHAHGCVYDTDYKSLTKLKRNLRKSFNIAPQNRCALKWYQNNNKNHTHEMKLKYHLVSIGYDGLKKHNHTDEFTIYIQ